MDMTIQSKAQSKAVCVVCVVCVCVCVCVCVGLTMETAESLSSECVLTSLCVLILRMLCGRGCSESSSS